ncbi:MAG: hypothetical protein GY913_33360 [Proteobacteria bacterium]|nr:hypothetical protein [Pseudomonadota bacterium]MCP4921815.1 hypothetical protein [Pseudomonadota bacterium]
MPWPTWIEELKTRYLADEANVFLLHGPPVREGRWAVNGKIVGAAEVLRAFLSQSRDIVGVLDPDPSDGKLSPDLRKAKLDFNGVDLGAFRRLVDVRVTLDAIRVKRHTSTVEGAFGVMWLALTTAGADQAYILVKVDSYAGVRRKRLPAFDHDAPPITEWPGHEVLRGSNNVIVILCEDPTTLRQELQGACVRIEVTPHDAAWSHDEEPDAASAAEAEIEDALSLKRVKAPPMADAVAEIEAAMESGETQPLPDFEETAPLPDLTEPLPDVDAVLAEVAAEKEAGVSLPDKVERAFRDAILRHAEGDWPQNLPGREALAEVLHALDPGRVGELTFTVEDGVVQAQGDGADWFMDWYRKDIAVDAACGMALGALEVPEGGFTEETLPALERPAVGALARRITKLLG